MKILKNIISGIIWTLMGLYSLLILLINIPSVQEYIGNQTASLLSDKLGTKVYIGNINPGFLNRIIIDDIQIYDLNNKKMFKSARISVKIDIVSLLHNKISISSAQVFGTHLKIYQETENSPTNIQFVIDALSSGDKKNNDTSLDLRINTFIMQHSSISFDRKHIAPTANKFNPSHINIKDISANISVKAINNDSVNVIVKKLAFKELSGININRLSFQLEGNRKKCKLSALCLKMPASTINLDSLTATYKLADNGIANGTLQFTGGISNTTINTTDLAFIIPKLKDCDIPINVSADLNGTDRYISVPRLNISSGRNELNINTSFRLSRNDNNTNWAVNLKNADLTSVFLTNICNRLNTDLTEKVMKLGDIHINGEAHSDNSNIKAVCKVEAQQIGSIEANLSLHNDRNFNGSIRTNGMKMHNIMSNEKFGTTDISIDLNGYLGKTINGSKIFADGTITNLEYNKYKYKTIDIHGKYADNSIIGTLKIDDPNIFLNIDGKCIIQQKRPEIKLRVSVDRFSPQTTNITSMWGDAIFKAEANTEIKGNSINDAVGFFSIENFSMASSQESYTLNSLDINTGFGDDGKHYLNMQSDFGKADISGTFNFGTLWHGIKNIISDKLPTAPGIEKTAHPTDNSFQISAHIAETDWLNALFGIPLELTEPAIINGIINDKDKILKINCDFPSFTYEGKRYTNGDIDIISFNDSISSCIGLTKIMDNGYGLDINVKGNAANNHLTTSFTWDNNSTKRIMGTLNTRTSFLRNADGAPMAVIGIQPSHLSINNAVWDIEPATITYTNKNIDIEKFAIINNEQHIIINGRASDNNEDSLTVDLRDIDIEYILELVNFHSVDFSGRATGRAYISAPFGRMSAHSTLMVNDFKFENGHMGTLNANVRWNNEEKQIDINAIAADRNNAMTLINGYVSPTKDYIDLGIRADGTYIEFMRSFTNSFMHNLNGQAKGEVRLAGPLKAINLTGNLTVNGDMTVTATNCRYFLRDARINFIPNEIMLENVTFYDIYNNQGTINGAIHHHNLSNLSYDLSVKANKLLAYDFRDFGSETFYGTVYGSGNVDIHGRSGELQIDINLTPQKNSTFVYNVSNPDAISDQGFIRWNDVTRQTENDTISAINKANTETTNISTDTHINFLINCTPETTIKVLMDSHTNDYITLNGNGSIRATYYNKGAFNMFGTYIVDHGTYGITIQDIIKKNFVFSRGGTIVFGGDPYDAALNLQAVYTVNGVSLSDLNIGNSFSNNTIRVNCLMNINGQPKSPKVDFDLDMPTVSSDEKQMIKSLINSEDEMNQQVVYLLGIGRFYPQDNNNSNAQNEKQQSQTSLAMQSLLSGTISSQISNMLGTVIKSNNWSFGANISTGDEGWNNAEYEGLLSGRLLNNRLLIDGQFGYRDNVNNANPSFIGDFDIRYLLLPNGNLAINIYNKTNDRYFTKSSLNTQGIGLIMKKDFSGIKDLFGTRKKKRKKEK